VTYPGSTPVSNATLVVTNVLTSNKHSPIGNQVQCVMGEHLCEPGDSLAIAIVYALPNMMHAVGSLCQKPDATIGGTSCFGLGLW
jgi:hypothetical protein